MPTPRPHHKERIAHAEGYEIERFDALACEWVYVYEPQWWPNIQYRVKPEPKPDVVLNSWMQIKDGSVDFVRSAGAKGANLRLTFDGETGQLKTAEVIQ